MSFTIPSCPLPSATSTDEDNRAKLFGSSEPKEKPIEQRKDEMIATLMVQLQKSLDRNNRMSDDLELIERERSGIIDGMSQTIERQNAIILQQQRKLQQPTGFKWLLSSIAALAMECFFFLGRLLKIAALKMKTLSLHTWKYVRISSGAMGRFLALLESRLLELGRSIQRFREHRVVRS